MKKRTRRQFLQAAGAAALAAGWPGSRANPAGEEQDAGETRPNILVLLSDSHRFDWLGGQGGNPIPTPNINALAREGVHFTQALCASPLCAPSRACLASGMEYDRNGGVKTNDYDYSLDLTTYYTLLRDAGYHVMGCGKLDLAKTAHSWGIDGRHDGKLLKTLGFSDAVDNAGKGNGMESYGFDEPRLTPKDPFYHYLSLQDPPLDRIYFEDMTKRFYAKNFKKRYALCDPLPEPIRDEDYGDNWIGRMGLQLLERAPKDKPWHLAVNFNGPHFPMDITAAMARRYRGPDRKIDGFAPPYLYEGPVEPEEHLRIRQNYSAMIENVDRWVGIYQQVLAERGELERTLVVYGSDHGEMLGDRSLWGKMVPVQPSVGIPLMVKGPGVTIRGENEALVSLIDLAATFLDYAGAKTPKEMDSRSFRGILEGRASKIRDHLLSGLDGWRNWRLAFDGRYKLITGYADEDLLFDLQEDPLENRNEADRLPEVVARLRKLLA